MNCSISWDVSLGPKEVTCRFCTASTSTHSASPAKISLGAPDSDAQGTWVPSETPPERLRNSYKQASQNWNRFPHTHCSPFSFLLWLTVLPTLTTSRHPPRQIRGRHTRTFPFTPLHFASDSHPLPSNCSPVPVLLHIGSHCYQIIISLKQGPHTWKPAKECE